MAQTPRTCAQRHRKIHAKSRQSNRIQTKELVHTDVYGPTRVASHKENRYVVIMFVDDFSRDRWVEFYKSKDEVVPALQKYLIIQKALRTRVKRLHSAKEFMNSKAMEEANTNRVTSISVCVNNKTEEN